MNIDVRIVQKSLKPSSGIPRTRRSPVPIVKGEMSNDSFPPSVREAARSAKGSPGPLPPAVIPAVFPEPISKEKEPGVPQGIKNGNYFLVGRCCCRMGYPDPLGLS